MSIVPSVSTLNTCLSFTGPEKRDVDLAGFVYDDMGQLLGWAFDKTSFGMALRHSGDSGDGKTPGIDEVLFIDYTKMPLNVRYIIVAVAIENCESTLNEFSEMKIDMPEIGVSYNLLDYKNTVPGARIFLPFALMRDGSTAMFNLMPMALVSPDAGLDYVWPLNEIALGKLMPGYLWEQRLTMQPGHQLKSGQTKFIHHREPISLDYDGHSVRPSQYKIDKGFEKGVEKESFYFGLGWETKADLDSHVYGLDASGKEIYHVYFGNKNSNDGAVSLDQDDRSGDGKAGDDDETIEVKTHKIDERVQYLIFGVQIYSGASNFKQIGGEFVRVYQKKKVDGKKTKKTMVKFNLDGNPSFDYSDAGVFCVLRRVARSWRFDATPMPTKKPISLAALHQAIKLK